MGEESSSPSLTSSEYHDDDEVTFHLELHNPYVITLIPKIPALISIVCATVFIHEVLVDMKSSTIARRGDKRVIPNMLLVLSISDMVLGFAWFLANWLAPKDQPNLWGNFGNTTSCVFGGILMQFGMVSSFLCNVGLSVYYLLVVKCNWRDSIRIENLEKWVHLCIWTITIPLMIIPIVFDMYNFNYVTCWVAPYPLGCNDSSYFPTGDAICERGEHAWIVSNVTGIIMIGSVIFCGVIMAIIYDKVRKLEEKISRYHGAVIPISIRETIDNTQNNGFVFNKNIQSSMSTSRCANGRNDKNVISNDTQEEQQRYTEKQPNNHTTTARIKKEDYHSHHEETTDYADDGDDDDDASSHMDENDVQDDQDPTNRTSFNTTEGRLFVTQQTARTNSTRLSSPTKNQQATNNNTESLQIQAQHHINREKSKRVALQGMWYIGAFLLTYALAFLSGALLAAGITFVPLDYAAYVMLPLQGFLVSMHFVVLGLK